MPITRHQYPILERSSQTSAVINPRPADAPFPRLCLMTFFREPLARLVEQYKGRVIGTYRSEMRPFEVYTLHDGSRELCAVQAAVGAAASAMLADWLYGKGVETILCCGSCGVLEDIPAGDVILPVRALRDEGGLLPLFAAGSFYRAGRRTHPGSLRGVGGSGRALYPLHYLDY